MECVQAAINQQKSARARRKAKNKVNIGSQINRDIFFAFSIAGIVFFTGCKEKHHAQSAPNVEVIEVIQKEVPIYDEYVGTLDGLVNAVIRAQVSGYLQTQDYNEGTFVKKGDLLFQIDPRPFQASLDIAKGQLAQAEAQYGKTQLDVNRYTPLAKKNAISQEELDNAIQANLAAKANVASAQASVEQANLNLGFTRVISPINGIAGIAIAQIGDLVGPSTGELSTVSTVDPIKVYFTLPEQTYISYYKKFLTETGQVRQDDGIELELILVNGTVYPQKGKISAVGRHVTPGTGTIRIEALFPNPGNVLRPGQFSRVRAKLDFKKGAILVPQRAVTETQGTYQVAVVDSNNQIEIRKVKAGERIDNLWVINDGLNAGDKVVAEGTEKVKTGMLVNPTPYQLPKEPNASP